MSRDLIASFASSLLPFFLLALTAFAAWAAAQVAAHLRDRRHAAAMMLLTYGAAGVVADFSQHLVADLKDPSKPGAWTRVTGASVRLQAIAMLRQLYPFAIEVVTRALLDPSKVDTLLGTLLERAVVDLKAKSPPRPVAASADATSAPVAVLPLPAGPAAGAPAPTPPSSAR